MPEWLSWLEEQIESASANIKFVDQALSGMEGSYVELLTVLSLGLLAILPVLSPERRRQWFRRGTQLLGIALFVFVVYTCLGVFGMIRNFHRGLHEIGRENIVALYYCSVPVTILATSMIFGPFFCGWICPTGALQEFASLIFGGWHRRWKRDGRPFRWRMLLAALFVTAVFLAWMAYLSATRIFFVEDASIYWSEVLVLLLLLLIFRMKQWDGRLRRLRVISFVVVVVAAIASLRITSPVHFGFSKVYDPASLLATVIVILSALAIPHIWCRYLCPWREAIAWAGGHAAREIACTPNRCISCGACDDACGVDAIHHGEIDARECHWCLKCVDRCPEKALRLRERWGNEDA